MLRTVRLYLDAMVAVATMAVVGAFAGLAVAAWSGDRRLALAAGAGAFALGGAVYVVRLWRSAHATRPPGPGI